MSLIPEAAGIVGPQNGSKNRITSDYIVSLNPHEVFVFGSNRQGYHGGGAAAMAHAYFGAVWGQGVGLQGQSYATLGRGLRARTKKRSLAVK